MDSQRTYFATVGLFLLFVSLTLVRLVFIRAEAFGHDPCLSCQAATSLQHDAGAWALAWAGLLLATFGRRLFRILGLGLFLAVFLLLLADVVVLAQFSMRLFTGDVIKFGSQPGAVWTYLGDSFGALTLLPALLGIGGILFTAWWLSRCRARRLARVLLSVMLAVSLLMYALPDHTQHPLPWTYQNVIEANWHSGTDRAFSQAFLDELMSAPGAGPAARECRTGEDLAADVLVVIVESLSWYHGGLLLPESLAATPALDALARENAWWPNFHANGWTTDHGLIAMIAGEIPLPAINRYRSMAAYEGYTGGAHSLPARLAADGYHTAFFTSGPLGFLGKGDWLRGEGFDTVEGKENPYYEGKPVYAFGAPGDGVLYARVLDWMRESRPPGRPLLAMVETVTTHPPFINPDTGEPDEAGAFRYADRELATFIEALAADGWLDENLLVITSDQRALTPVTPAERDAFGPAAGARLPLIMLGGALTLEGPQPVMAQMADMPYSLDRLLTPGACGWPRQGDWFRAEPPACVLQPEGNRRDMINAWCGENAARIMMDGDDTRVIEGELPDQAFWIRLINEQRARLGEREVNIERVL